MSILVAAPELIADAATNLATIGSNVGSALAAAAGATTGVLPAAADEVSGQIAALFSAHAARYQQLSVAAATFHEQFVHTLTAGANTYALTEANVVQTLANLGPAVAVGFSDGLSGSLQTAETMAASMTFSLPGSVNAALAAVGGVFGITPSLGVNIAAGLSGLSAQANAALSGGLSANLSGLPTLVGNAVAPFQVLAAAGTPAAFFTQLQAMELGFNSALVNGEFSFNAALVGQEAAVETAIFGGTGAVNGVIDSAFNFWNTVLGTGELTADTMLGAQVPAGFLGSVVFPGGGGAIGGLLGALDQKLLFDLDVAGAATAAVTGNGSLQAALLAAVNGTGLQASLGGVLNGSFAASLPASAQALLGHSPIGLLQQLAADHMHLANTMLTDETGFNQNLLNSEVTWEATEFGPSAFNGALNRAFNVVNLVPATAEQTVNSILVGAQGPSLDTIMTGTGQQVFNGGLVGGLEGIFDQILAAGADLHGFITGT